MKIKYLFLLFVYFCSGTVFLSCAVADNVINKHYIKSIFDDKDADSFIRSKDKLYIPYYIDINNTKEYHISYVDYDIEMFSRLAILLDKNNKIKNVCGYDYNCIDDLFIKYISNKYKVKKVDVEMLILNMESFRNSAGKELSHIIHGYNKNDNSFYYVRDTYFRFKTFHAIVSSVALMNILNDIPISSGVNILVDLGYFRTMEIDGFKITGKDNIKVLEKVSFDYVKIAKDKFGSYIDKKTKKGFSAIESASIVRFKSINSLNKVLEKMRENDKNYEYNFSSNIKTIHDDLLLFVAKIR